MEEKVKEIYGQYDAKRKAFEADSQDIEELEKSIKYTKGKK